jgi:glycosyltransferase involved in cell wall biosynthesis
MICPRLAELPSAPAGKTGWPWTEESSRLTDTGAKGPPWPRISVITPSFNRGEFLEETVRSILLQGYPDLEYLVLDGGSTDNSFKIIKKYSPWINYWVSQPDSGQSDAINRGLKQASGDYATWINSDDMLCRNAIVDHALQNGFAPNTVYVGICLYIDASGTIRFSHQGRVNSFDDLVRIGPVWRSSGHIVQPEVLFPRELALAVGGLDAANYFTMDYDLWGKFFLAGATFQYTDIPFGMFREHPDQKTNDVLRTTQSLLSTAAQLAHVAGCFSEETRKKILVDLEDYKQQYLMDYWRGTGRLAKIGLPPIIVNIIRRVKAKLQKDVR